MKLLNYLYFDILHILITFPVRNKPNQLTKNIFRNKTLEGLHGEWKWKYEKKIITSKLTMKGKWMTEDEVEDVWHSLFGVNKEQHLMHFGFCAFVFCIFFFRPVRNWIELGPSFSWDAISNRLLVLELGSRASSSSLNSSENELMSPSSESYDEMRFICFII